MIRLLMSFMMSNFSIEKTAVFVAVLILDIMKLDVTNFKEIKIAHTMLPIFSNVGNEYKIIFSSCLKDYFYNIFRILSYQSVSR